jgi:hypothetical protein
MVNFRIIYGIPYFLTPIKVYNPFDYFINDSIGFEKSYMIIDIGYLDDAFKLKYEDIKSFAKIGRYSLEITFNKEALNKLKKKRTIWLSSSLVEIDSIYISSWKIDRIIQEFERHKIHRMKDSKNM